MPLFSNLLKDFMEMNGYTVYRLALLSGVNRTTIQRALMNGRVPQREALEKIVEVLKLTDFEKIELMDAYEILTDGEYKYKRRRYMKKLLEGITEPVATETSAVQIKESRFCSLEISPRRLIQGSMDIQRAISLLLNNEICNHAFPQISILLPMQEDFLSRVFSGIHSDVFEKLKIHQLIYLIKRPEINENDGIHNLRILTNILPVVLRKTSDYHVYYSYMDSSMMSDMVTGFPYYILFSDCVLLLSPDLETAWLENSPQLIFYIKNIFLSFIRQGRELILQLNTVPEYLLKSLSEEKNVCFEYSIEYQPCFLSFCNRQLLEACANRDLPDREKMLQLVLERINQFNSSGKNIIIFNSNSLERFIEDGIVVSVPKGFARPCTIEERLYLLEQLEKGCREEHHFIRAVNSVYFDIGNQVYVSLQKNKEVSLYTYDLSNQVFHFVSITENTIYDAFYDFIQYLTQTNSKYLFTKDETLESIIQYKKLLIYRMHSE